MARPDMKAAMQALDVDELNIKGAKNALLPSLALGGGYTSAGRGGVFFPRTTTGLTGTALAPVPGGIGDAFSQLFNGATTPLSACTVSRITQAVFSSIASTAAISL